MILIKLAIGIISTSLIVLMLYVIGRITIHGIDPKEKTPGITICLLASLVGLLGIGLVGTLAIAMAAIGHIVMHIIG
jgi:hypothetical protein